MVPWSRLMSHANDLFRIRLLSVLVVLFALVLGIRLYVVQVVHGDEFRDEATQQYTRPADHVFNRGSVSFSAKDGTQRAAAIQESGFVLAANARLVTNTGTAYTKLTQYVDLNEQKFVEELNDDDPYVVLAERLSDETAEKIRDLNLPGFDIYPQKWRRYPHGSLAAHVLGYVGYDDQGDQKTGLYGVERFYNETLSRDDSSGLYVNFFAQVFSGIGDTLSGQGITRDGNVTLTIEPDVQSYLEKLLADTKAEWSSEQMMGVVIDPNTGAVKAMAANPTFDPNNYSEVSDPSVFTNPIVQSRYEMGSIIKPLTVAAGLDAGEITADTTYKDTGDITLNGSTISNYDGEARGVVDMQTVLSQSLNTGVAYVAKLLGHERMREYFYGYGLNKKTGIDLPNEVNSDVENLTVERDLEFATASFGQGIALTPITTVQALSTLANGGKVVEPHVTKSINYRLGGTEEIDPEVGEQVLEKEASEEISRMLVNVVDEALAGGNEARERHSIAAKTGTAQVAKPGGGYYDNQYNHTFFGYFPAYDPEYLVFLMARRPEGARYASQTLTDPFVKMTDFLLNYYNIAPDR